MCTPGCHGNRGRPHKLVGEQKTQRPSSTEARREKGRDGEKNQISFFSRWGGVGGVARWRVHIERRNKYQEVVGENEGGWMDGWMVQVRRVHK